MSLVMKFNRVLRELKRKFREKVIKRAKAPDGQGIGLSSEAKKEYFKQYYQQNKNKMLSNQKQLNSKTKYKTLKVLKELPINLLC